MSTFSIPVIVHGLFGTPSNLELRNIERRGVARLSFNDVSLAGLTKPCVSIIRRGSDVNLASILQHLIIFRFS